MGYDENLAARVSEALKGTPQLTEKVMFGGIGYLVNGNMACGVYQDNLIVRVGLERYQSSLEEPWTKIFDITGRVMKGWIMIAPEGCGTEDGLKSWIQAGLNFALTLPPK